MAMMLMSIMSFGFCIAFSYCDVDVENNDNVSENPF